MTRGAIGAVAGVMIACLLRPAPAGAWGEIGHRQLTRAAVGAAHGLPQWFRGGRDALVDLSTAPDRWRDVDGVVPALAARRPDHFFDLDDWGAEPLPPDRWAYVRRATQRRLRPERIGFLPFAILEEYGVLVSALRDARSGRAGGRPAVLAAAGTLAHLVGDATVPLHATRHHHGWVGPNPRGFTRSRGVHRWFESELVEDVRASDLDVGRVEPLTDVHEAVVRALETSLGAVPRLYADERRGRGGRRAARALAVRRLEAGANLLARLWLTAWNASRG